MKRTLWVTMVVSGFLLLQGCSTVPVTGRHQLNLISANEEMQLGLSSFDQIKKETPASTSASDNATAKRVGERIAAVAAKDMPDAKWEFVVFQTAEPNAFALPGGKVGINSGILPLTQNDAGLATVMAHEIGHVIAHHGAERMSEAMVMQTGGQVLGSAVSAYDPKWQNAASLAYGVGTKLGRELPHSRAQESEADHIGLILMARAGYDPREAVAFWERFMAYNNQHGGANTPSFLRTHPLDQVRIQQLKQWLPEAEAALAASKAK